MAQRDIGTHGLWSRCAYWSGYWNRSILLPIRRTLPTRKWMLEKNVVKQTNKSFTFWKSTNVIFHIKPDFTVTSSKILCNIGIDLSEYLQRTDIVQHWRVSFQIKNPYVLWCSVSWKTGVTEHYRMQESKTKFSSLHLEQDKKTHTTSRTSTIWKRNAKHWRSDKNRLVKHMKGVARNCLSCLLKSCCFANRAIPKQPNNRKAQKL